MRFGFIWTHEHTKQQILKHRKSTSYTRRSTPWCKCWCSECGEKYRPHVFCGYNQCWDIVRRYCKSTSNLHSVTLLLAHYFCRWCSDHTYWKECTSAQPPRASLYVCTADAHLFLVNLCYVPQYWMCYRQEIFSKWWNEMGQLQRTIWYEEEHTGCEETMKCTAQELSLVEQQVTMTRCVQLWVT